MRDIRVLMIGGTSHAGKSTLAESLAARFGWDHVSTDRLGRHPGRPWATSSGPFPEHLATHYRSLRVDELTAEQLRHYCRLWTRVEALVTGHAASPGSGRLVIEGSGILPGRFAALKIPQTAAVWLTASADVLRDRIYSASRFHGLTAEEKLVVDKFLGRTQRYDQLILNAVSSLGLPSIDTTAASPGELMQQCLRVIG